MKVLQVDAYPECRILDLPIPEPGPDQVVMRVDGVTTCPQWDLHLRHNEPMFAGHQFEYPYTPGQPGHEATGVVTAIGPGVTTLAVGDRVSAWRDAGHHVHGCYAQYVLQAADSVIRVPARLSVQETASVELAMCVGAVFLMLNEMNALQGREVGVMGLGPAGMVAAQMARAEGATRVVGMDLTESRRTHALAQGWVDEAYDPREETDALPGRPGWPRLGTIVDCVGAKRSVEWAMDHSHDVVALFGVQREEYTWGIRHYMAMRLCGYRGHSREAAEYAVGLMERGVLDLGPLVTHSLPLEKYQEGIDLLERQEAIKVLFLPWAE